MELKDFKWVREPKSFAIFDGGLAIVTEPFTDLWQRTYYNFRNDNAPLFLAETEERFFSFSVKTCFACSRSRRFDQCGIAVYQDGENWLKASAEYASNEVRHLGSVVTNFGYSDWAMTEIDGGITEIWYRLSRRESDFSVEYSFDGVSYRQMRMCHLAAAEFKIRFGVYACSPENSSFRAEFSEFSFGKCLWNAHK